MAILHTAEHIVPAPRRYPDLFPVLNVLLCSFGFGMAWLWGLRKQLEAGWAIGGLGSGLHKKQDSVSSPSAASQPTETQLKTTASISPSSRRFSTEVRLPQEVQGNSSKNSVSRFDSGSLRSRRESSMGIPASMMMRPG